MTDNRKCGESMKHGRKKLQIRTLQKKKDTVLPRSPSASGNVRERMIREHQNKQSPGKLSDKTAQTDIKLKQAKETIRKKNTDYHIVKEVGRAGRDMALEQIEGGEEMKDATEVAYQLTTPVTNAAQQSGRMAGLIKGVDIRSKSGTAKKERVRREKAFKIVRQQMKSKTKAIGKDTIKEGVKKVTGEVAKETAKTAVKKTVKATSTAAGSVAAPGAGTALGIAVGYVTGIKVEESFTRHESRMRMLAFMKDKLQESDKQKDSLAKLTKDLVIKRIRLEVKKMMPVIGLSLFLMISVIGITAYPVISSLAVLYNSPFAILLPALQEGDTVSSVLSELQRQFNEEIELLALQHEGYDDGKIVYVDYEGISAPNNLADMIAVYMVRHGNGDTATVINDISKRWLATVFHDMCKYDVSEETEIVETTDENGNVYSQSKRILCVNVTIKTSADMIAEYGFTAEQAQILSELLNTEMLAGLGQTGDKMEGTTLPPIAINGMLSAMSSEQQRAICSFALSKVGYPYSQALRDSGDYYDCSSLSYYACKNAGIDVSFGGANTAAAQAQGLESSGRIVSLEQIQPGDLIFYSYKNNGRYRNISHVAIYVGNGHVVEALNPRSGVVYRPLSGGSIVLIGRP